jgi:hypothetical protein
MDCRIWEAVWFPHSELKGVTSAKLIVTFPDDGAVEICNLGLHRIGISWKEPPVAIQ